MFQRGAFLLLLFCGTAVAEPKDRLVWLFMNWPPFFQMQGDSLQGGVTGDHMRQLFARLPEYEHVTRQVTVMRLQIELRSTQHVCSMPIQKTPERERIMLFTGPVDVGLNTRLYVREDIAKQLDDQDVIALDQVVAMPNLHGVIHRARSYGPLIDRLLATPGATPNLERQVLESDNVLKMLDSGRIHYTIEYPIVVRYWEQRQATPRSAFRSYRIAGTEDFSLGYIACSNTEWGKQAVARINQAFRELVGHPEFQQSRFDALSKTEQQTYQHYWQQYIVEQKPVTR